MPGDSLEPPSVGPVAAPELPQALRLLYSRLDENERAAATVSAIAQINAAAANDNVLVATRRRGQIVGAVWLQIRPGRVGVLQPYGLEEHEPHETASTIIDAAVSEATAMGVQFFQTLLDADYGPAVAALRCCGFRHAADMLKLVSLPESFPTSQLESELEYEPLDESVEQFARLKSVIEQTYRGSKDCPTVQNMRSIDDVLASYRATGKFDPSRWFVVRNAQSDVGCLLLAEHPAVSLPPVGPPSSLQWELTYMGVVAEARGRGYGIEIVRHAQWLAAQARAERLILAVDAANSPAIRVYSAAGFEAWDRRSVFLRTK